MKITKTQLKRLIKEELEAVMAEDVDEGLYTRRGGSTYSAALHDRGEDRSRSQWALQGMRSIEGMLQSYKKDCEERGENCDKHDEYVEMYNNYAKTVGYARKKSVDPEMRGVQRYPEKPEV